MNKLPTWLSGLLVLQIAITVGLLWINEHGQNQNRQQALLSFTPEQVDRAVISDADKSITLAKVDGRGRLTDSSLPVDTQKLNLELNKLHDLQTGWPVATTDSSHKRFEVSADKFQRHIQLYQGDDAVAELYLGTSPGFRQVNVRRPEDDRVYAATLATYEFPVDNDAWLDKSLLAVTDIETISGPDYTLKKVDDDWELAGDLDGDSAKADPDKAKQLAAALSGLQILAVANSDPAPDSAQGAATVKVTGAEGSWEYTFCHQKDDYYVSRSDRDTIFKISKPSYDAIVGVHQQQLASSGASSNKETGESVPSTNS